VLLVYILLGAYLLSAAERLVFSKRSFLISKRTRVGRKVRAIRAAWLRGTKWKCHDPMREW
jgi:hypothetical protein